MPLVSALDPSAPFTPPPVEEAEAYQAFQTLKRSPQSPAVPEATARLSSYVKTRRAKDPEGPLFPTVAGQAERLRSEHIRDLVTKPLADVLPAETFAALEARAATAPDPDAFRARQVIRTVLQLQTGTKIPAAKYDFIRSALARQLGAENTDTAVRDALARQYTDHAKATESLTRFAGEIQGKLLMGDTAGAAELQRATLAGLPENLREAGMSEIFRARREARDLKRRTAGPARSLARYLGRLTSRAAEADDVGAAAGDDASADPVAMQEAVAMLRGLPADERAAVLTQAASIAEGLYSADSTAKTAAETALTRLSFMAAQGSEFVGQTVTGLGAAVDSALGLGSDPERQARADARAQILSAASAVPTYHPADSWYQNVFIAGAGQLPTFASVFGGPAGLGFLGTSIAGQSYQTQRVTTPDADPRTQLATAAGSGLAQLGAEVFMTRAGLQFLRGKSPTIAGILSRTGIRNKYLRGTLGGTMNAAAAFGTEYTEEIVQGAIDNIAADAARELSGIDPATDWPAFFRDWIPGNSRMSEETLYALLPYALIGAGAAGSYQHFKHGDFLQRSRPMLRAIGLPDPVIDSIQQADPVQAAQLTRQAFQTEREIRTAAERQAAIESFREAAATWSQAGYPIVDSTTNSFTEETTWFFQRDPFDPSTRQEFETEQEALEAWMAAAQDIETDALDALVTAAQEDILRTTIGEGTVLEGKAQAIPLTGPAPRLQDAANVRDYQGKPFITPGEIAARLKAFLLQGGSQRDVANLVVKARRQAERLRNGMTRQILQYFRDTDPVALLEDSAEAFLDQSIADGFLTATEILPQIRRAEAATGRSYLQEGYTAEDFEAGNTMPILEAFSALVRDYAFANLRSEALPDSLRQWVSVTAITSGNQFAYALELARAPKLAAALREGRLDASFENLLADAIGIDTAARDARMRQAYQAQLAAEALEGFPEISDAARGKLPHPQTLRDAGDPLAGEVQRIYDHFKKPVTRNGKTYYRTNEANDYFLPVGTSAKLDQLRESLNEKGFAFDTIDDMLAALDDSLGYGIKHHATMSLLDEAGDSSFSLGRATVTPGAETRSFPTQDGGLIGPASFAISAYHGTPHKVDKFSLEKIGTGEGAQAYGWGLYFASSKDVAEQYRINLAYDPDKMKINGRQINAEYSRIDKLANTGSPKDWLYQVMDGLERLMTHESPEQVIEYGKEAEWDRQALDYFRTAKFETFGALYTVTLKVENDQLLDWDKPLDKQSKTIKERLKKAGIWKYLKDLESDFSAPSIARGREKRGHNIYAAVTYKTGSEQQASRSLAAAGIRGIRYLDGNSRGDGQGTYNYVIFDESDIEITEENGQPVIPSAQSYALSPASINRIEGAIAEKMAAGPQERADYLNRLRDRLAGVLIRYKEHALTPDSSAVDVQLRAAREAIEETRTIVDALPPEARGRVRLPITEILDAKTQRGRVTSMLRLIDEADAALETVLRDSYTEALGRLLDLAKPDLNPATRQARGRLTPTIQAEVDQIIALIQLTPIEAGLRQHNAEVALQRAEDRLNGIDAELQPEELQAAQEAYIAARVDHARANIFAGVLGGSAADLAHAHDQLLALYKQGRYQRGILDDSRRQELWAARSEILGRLKTVLQPHHRKAGEKDGFRELMRSFRMGHYSFHQVMETLFPGSSTAAEHMDRARKADTGYRRAIIHARKDWEQWARTNLDLPARNWRFKLQKVLAEISTPRDFNIELREGVKFETVALEEAQAVAILEGRMKVGWEQDVIAMDSLRQALMEFRLLRDRDKKRVQTVKFQRLISRGQPAFYRASDLEAAYLLQLAAQKEYRPTLDAYGFTETVIREIEAAIDDRALRMADYLQERYAAEYDRLNPVFQRLFGFNMPRIRNYAPARFHHQGEAAVLDPEAGDAAPVNALSSGFTKSRVHHLARPKAKNALGLYWEHIAATEYFIHWAELIRDMRAVYLDPKIKFAIEGNFGPKVAGDFFRWLDVLAADGNVRAIATAADAEMSARMQASLAAVGLAYNFGSVLKQIPAALNGFLEMPVRDMLAGAREVIREPRHFATVWNSETIQQRIEQGFSPEDRRLLQAAAANPSVILEAYRVGRLPLAYGDAVATGLYASAVYAGSRARALRGGLSEQAAHDLALAHMDRVVKRTAQPATTQDRSLAELTASRQGMLIGYIFRSDPRQKAAIIMQAAEDLAAGRISRKTFARRVLFGWIIYGVANEFMADVWAGMSRDDDPERWNWRDYLAAAVSGPLGGLGVAGGIMEAAIRGSIGTDFFASKTYAASAGDLFLQNRGSRIVSTLIGESGYPDLGEFLKDILADSRDYATILSPFTEKAGAVAVGARIVRDAYGVIDNLTESEPERQDRILSEFRATQKTRQEEARRIRETTRPAAVLTPQERALRALSTEHRAEAIRRIVAPYTPAERQAYLARLADLGILTPATRAVLDGAN